MIALSVVCRASVHESADARAAGCVCPVGWGIPYRPPAKMPRRTYVRGRIANRRGPRNVTEPDWAAVERAMAGDHTIVLAVIERDEAIDRLDLLGLSAQQIAIRLGVTSRTVQRRRARRRAGSRQPAGGPATTR